MTHFSEPTKTSKVILGKTTYILNMMKDQLGAVGYYLQEEEPGKAPTDPIFLSERQAKALNMLLTTSKKA